MARPCVAKSAASPASIAIHQSQLSMTRRASSQVASRLAQVPIESATGAVASA
jgi:hypothetical protein